MSHFQKRLIYPACLDSRQAMQLGGQSYFFNLGIAYNYYVVAPIDRPVLYNLSTPKPWWFGWPLQGKQGQIPQSANFFDCWCHIRLVAMSSSFEVTRIYQHLTIDFKSLSGFTTHDCYLICNRFPHTTSYNKIWWLDGVIYQNHQKRTN